MSLHADDFVTLCDYSYIQKLKNKTENEFYEIDIWIKINKISLNYKKTKHVLFSRGKSFVQNFAINTTNGSLINSNVIKNLGVVFGHKLSWKQHTHYVAAKLCKARRLLTKLRRFVSVTVSRNAYFGIVHSYLMWCNILR